MTPLILLLVAFLSATAEEVNPNGDPSTYFVKPDVDENKVIIYLNQRASINASITINEDTLAQVNATLPTVIIVHGWRTQGNATWMMRMAQEYLKKADMNVIRVDWYAYARLHRYDASAMKTRGLGKVLAGYIAELKDNHGLKLTDVHCVGHSLGAHVCGFFGKEVFKKTNEKIARISALDPAGPSFEIPFLSSTKRLSKTDAIQVIATHTDAGFLGFKKQIGVVDFYPNGGHRHQPGCNIAKIGCSHSMAIELFIYSINTNDLQATKCPSELRYNLGVCKKNLKIAYGENCPVGVSGKYYFKTNKAAPFKNVL